MNRLKVLLRSLSTASTQSSRLFYSSSNLLCLKNSQKFNTPNHFLKRWDIITSLMIFAGLIEEQKDSPLILCIKKGLLDLRDFNPFIEDFVLRFEGILATKESQYQKADMLYHTALKMANDLSYKDAETYIFDLMADNYFEWNDFEKAKPLYLEVLNRIPKENNFSLEKIPSEAVVEISIKLAYCYSHLGQSDFAEKGFQFSIDSQLIRVDSFWNDKECRILIKNLNDEQSNSLALLGMAYDYYSKYLEQLSSQLLERSLIYRKKAHQISSIINGIEHSQTIVLENNIADIYSRMEKFDLAKECLHGAIEKAKAIKSKELPILYLNLASIHCQENRKDLATQFCRKTISLIEEENNVSGLNVGGKFSTKERDLLRKKSELCLKGLKFY
uniref:Tetratricopeptide repeat protein 19, mitochondrial n=1 Tax=Sarcoptes scabiei TaxID=52283 RepID=A0A834VE76_SARSC